jgi:GNAT superfamily N-acetyltransferase
MKIITDPISAEKKQACIEITKQLPTWFGQEESNKQYAEDALKYPALLVKDDDNRNIGLLVYKTTFDEQLDRDVIDIHWLGVMPEYHRKGLGKELAHQTALIALENNIQTLTVETLDPAAKDESYLKSYSFYLDFGFKTYHKFSYGEKTPMIKMRTFLV